MCPSTSLCLFMLNIILKMPLLLDLLSQFCYSPKGNRPQLSEHQPRRFPSFPWLYTRAGILLPSHLPALLFAN